MLNKEKINWGILGTGKAAYNFAKALSISQIYNFDFKYCINYQTNAY